MAAIRDWSWFFKYPAETTIVIPVPKYVEGDLLLAILSTDSGAQTWSCSGWTQLFSVTNETNLAVMYKIASASEPADYTFSYTTSSTANGVIVSIPDADPSTIFADHDTANITTNREAMPVSVASRNNSLVIYCWSHTLVGTKPSAIEGPVTFITSKDNANFGTVKRFV